MSRQEADLVWYDSSFAELVSNPEVREAAQCEMARLAVGSGVSPQLADLEAARRYLRKCVLGMSVIELETLGPEQAGALWARGALGAAHYRVDRGTRKRRHHRGLRHRSRGAPREED